MNGPWLMELIVTGYQLLKMIITLWKCENDVQPSVG